MIESRWKRLMETLELGENETTFRSIKAAYSERHRHYHTPTHVEDCLSHLDRSASHAEHPREIELAIWFHDAIYRPLAGNNEQRSAEWASAFLLENAAPPETIERVRRLILVTDHQHETRTRDESLLVDIDLSILGADAEAYDEYERSIRKEYRIVPWLVYRRKRAAVLEHFLQRAQIYHQEPFHSEREARAKDNLTRALSRLRGRA